MSYPSTHAPSHQAKSLHEATDFVPLRKRSELKMKKPGSNDEKRWQYVTMTCVPFVLASCLALVGYSVYQMYVIELFDKLIDSFDLTSSFELSKQLPRLSTAVDQVLLSIGGITALIALSWCVFGGCKKHRTCTTASILGMFVMAGVAMSIATALLFTERKFLKLVKMPEINLYGLVNASTGRIDQCQGLFACCGSVGISDYEKAPCFQPIRSVNCSAPVGNLSAIPTSCCKNPALAECNHGIQPGKPDNKALIYTRGCNTVIEGSVKRRLRIVSSLLVSLATVVIFTLPWMCCFYRAITDDKQHSLSAWSLTQLQHGCHNCNTYSHSFSTLPSPEHTRQVSDPRRALQRDFSNEIKSSLTPTCLEIHHVTAAACPSCMYHKGGASLKLLPNQSLKATISNGQVNNVGIPLPITTVMLTPSTDTTNRGERIGTLVVMPAQVSNLDTCRVPSTGFLKPTEPGHYGDASIPTGSIEHPYSHRMIMSPTEDLYHQTARAFSDNYEQSDSESDGKPAIPRRPSSNSYPMRRGANMRTQRSTNRFRRRGKRYRTNH